MGPCTVILRILYMVHEPVTVLGFLSSPGVVCLGFSVLVFRGGLLLRVLRPHTQKLPVHAVGFRFKNVAYLDAVPYAPNPEPYNYKP